MSMSTVKDAIFEKIINVYLATNLDFSIKKEEAFLILMKNTSKTLAGSSREQ